MVGFAETFFIRGAMYFSVSARVYFSVVKTPLSELNRVLDVFMLPILVTILVLEYNEVIACFSLSFGYKTSIRRVVCV